MVQKFIKLVILYTYKDSLETYQSPWIKKEFSLSSYQNKKVVAKIKLQYVINNKEEMKEFYFKNLWNNHVGK